MGFLKKFRSSFGEKPLGNDVVKKESTGFSNSDKHNSNIHGSDKELDALQKADLEYQQDGNLEKRISIYEKYLLKKPKWNAFNFSLALTKMYVKAGRNNDAWGYLNQLYCWALQPDSIGINVSKIRYEQFRILKSEKKHKDAMVMLVSSYVLNAYSIKGNYFNKSKFIKEAKTTAKSIGFTDDSLVAFADSLEKSIKKQEIREADIPKYCDSFLES